MKPVGLGIVGVGGYGRTYMAIIEQMEKEGSGRLVAAVIRDRAKYAKEVGELQKRGVAIRASLGEMLAQDGASVEIVAIPTGIPTHCPMMIEPVEAGKNVILEKPPTAAIQEMDRMLAALLDAERWCQVGFQSQGNPTVVGLKRLICEGRLGAVKSVTVKGKWVRRDSYYQRNAWAGRIHLGDAWVLDGTVNNPLAHYLMNALYFASPVWGRIAEPAWVQAELYRAHDIEAEDTSALRVQTREGALVHFFATLAASKTSLLEIEVIGEKGRAVWPAKGDTVIEFADGRKEAIQYVDERYREEVFRNPIKYLRGEASELNCPLAMTRNFVLALNGAWKSAGRPQKIPREMLHIYHDAQANSRAVEIPGIEEVIDRAFAEKKLYAELGAPWAVSRKPFALAGFDRFTLE